MHGYGKSDNSIVPEKLSNKSVPTRAERAEGSGLAKSNSFQQNRYRTQGRENLQNALERIRQAANRDKRQKCWRKRSPASFSGIIRAGIMRRLVM